MISLPNILQIAVHSFSHSSSCIFALLAMFLGTCGGNFFFDGK